MSTNDSQDLQTRGRNDPAIADDARNVPTPSNGAKAPKDPQPVTDKVARDNEYSPDFKPEREPKPKTDADIDTQGG